MTKLNKRHGTNDAIEKKWLWNNEMFADVCNVLLFDGKKVVQPGRLEPAEVLSYYGSSSRDQLFVQKRDVAKVVTLADDRKVRVAFFGIENQSVPALDMAIRVMDYDAASLCQQILDRKAGGSSVRYHAVKTIVLNYRFKNKDEVVNLKKVLNPYTAYYVEQAEEKIQAEEAKKYQLAQAKEKLDYFKRLVSDLNLTEEQAMDFLGCTPADLENYKKLIAESNK